MIYFAKKTGEQDSANTGLKGYNIPWRKNCEYILTLQLQGKCSHWALWICARQKAANQEM